MVEVRELDTIYSIEDPRRGALLGRGAVSRGVVVVAVSVADASRHHVGEDAVPWAVTCTCLPAAVRPGAW